MHENKDILPFLREEIETMSFDKTIEKDEKYYVGFPFLTAKKGDVKVRAPILFYPVNITDGIIKRSGRPFLNRALFLLLEGSRKRRKLFEKADKISFSTLKQTISECGINYTFPKNEKMTPISRLNAVTYKATVKYHAVLGCFPVFTALQEEYRNLIKNNLSNTTLQQLFLGKIRKKHATKECAYFAEELDFSQKKVVKANGENVVLFGPPGTGKSQTIAAVAESDVINGKNVLVVSQKKVALDVIHKRLDKLGKNVLFLAENMGKEDFCSMVRAAHEYTIDREIACDQSIKTVEKELEKKLRRIEENDEKLHKQTNFGLSLLEMYELSFSPGEESGFNAACEKFSSYGLESLSFQKLVSDVDVIKNSNLIEHFVEYKEVFDRNPLVKHIVDTDVSVLDAVRKIARNKFDPFPFDKFEFSDFILPYLLSDIYNAGTIAEHILSVTHPRLSNACKICCFLPLWLILPFIMSKKGTIKGKIEQRITEFTFAWTEYVRPLFPLRKILDDTGYSYVVNHIAHGADMRDVLMKTCDNYLTVLSMKKTFSGIDDEVNGILLFCFEQSDKTVDGMKKILEQVVPIATYHRLKRAEETTELLGGKEYESIRKAVLELTKKRQRLTQETLAHKTVERYREYTVKKPDRTKRFLFRLDHPSLSVKRMFEEYGDFLFRLFPCILSFPEGVALLPLKKDIFGTVIFDEASQLYTENTVPALFRGKRTIIAGDDKQLSPSCAFLRKNSEDIENTSENAQNAMEAKSLLDIAKNSLTPFHLRYHYRSERSELIDFSNKYFYGGKLFVAPNVTNAKATIEYRNVKGIRSERKNVREANEVVSILDTIPQNESVGIVTFNVEQAKLIEEKITGKSLNTRKNLFVKSIENVQGEECDVIVFSIGYAPDETGKVYARYGLLGVDGGEKRINVAVTRAKKKVYVVTSLEPEQLPLTSVKNEGPKLLGKYIEYAKEISVVTCSALPSEDPGFIPNRTEKEIKYGLERLGYSVFEGIGTCGYTFSLAVYDEKTSRFLLAIESDNRASFFSREALERDLDLPLFMEKKGWVVFRVWSHDWWLSPQNVLADICRKIEENRRKYLQLSSLNVPLSLAVKDKTGKDVPIEVSKK